jgi:hypothetical protein
VCIHKGLFPPSVEKQFPHLLQYSDVRDVGKAAKDWPQLNFIIYHGAYRFPGGGTAAEGWKQFEDTGRVEWVSDLADIPAKFGVKNVYADVGQLFAQSTVAEPRLSAVMMGPSSGLGSEPCAGAPTRSGRLPWWQIEALRRRRSRKTSSRTASPRSGRPTAQSRPRFSAATTRLYNSGRSLARIGTTSSPSEALYEAWRGAHQPRVRLRLEGTRSSVFSRRTAETLAVFLIVRTS